ncbi:13640_t:CDS:2, partial [Racocetra persica]
LTAPKWLQLKQAFALWVDNALNMNQDINGYILKAKAKFFADHLNIDDFHYSIDEELKELIDYLPENDYLAAHEYIHIEDGKLESGLTDNEILEVIKNKNEEEEENHSKPVEQIEKVSSREAEINLKKILRFLYEQEPEFGEVEGEVRILNKLYKTDQINCYKKPQAS